MIYRIEMPTSPSLTIEETLVNHDSDIQAEGLELLSGKPYREKHVIIGS